MNFTNIALAIMGQSNEQGAAGYTASKISKFVPLYGHPNNDLTGNGTKGFSTYRGSTWTPLANKLSRRKNVRIYGYNAAVGGTGVVDHWVGYLTTYQLNTSGFGTNAGTWVLPTTPNGFKYKAIGTGANSSIIEPIWGTTIGANTTDGAIAWKCYAVDANDVLGHVYQAGESGYDPNGYIAAAKVIINAIPAGMDKKCIYVGGNQADLTGIRYKTAAIRAQAQINLVNDLLATYPNHFIFIGLTSYWNTGFEGTPNFRSYDVVMKPSLDLVLANFANTPNVYAGADWFTSLGKTISYVTGESDAVHMSTETKLKSVEPCYVKFIASGVF